MLATSLLAVVLVSGGSPSSQLPAGTLAAVIIVPTIALGTLALLAAYLWRQYANKWSPASAGNGPSVEPGDGDELRVGSGVRGDLGEAVGFDSIPQVHVAVGSLGNGGPATGATDIYKASQEASAALGPDGNMILVDSSALAAAAMQASPALPPQAQPAPDASVFLASGLVGGGLLSPAALVAAASRRHATLAEEVRQQRP
jgi:hypothetical protein